MAKKPTRIETKAAAKKRARAWFVANNMPGVRFGDLLSDGSVWSWKVFIRGTSETVTVNDKGIVTCSAPFPA